MVYTDEQRLFCQDTNTLHEFAEKIGLRPGWFNPKKKVPYYDIWHFPLLKAKKIGVLVVTPDSLNKIMNCKPVKKPESNVR